LSFLLGNDFAAGMVLHPDVVMDSGPPWLS